MILYNCVTALENQLKSTNLEELTNQEKRDLAARIHKSFMDGELEDEVIVMDALLQIVESM